VYNETVFQGIDYILATLAKHNIKAIINLLTCARHRSTPGHVANASLSERPLMLLMSRHEAADVCKVYCASLCERASNQLAAAPQALERSRRRPAIGACRQNSSATCTSAQHPAVLLCCSMCLKYTTPGVVVPM